MMLAKKTFGYVTTLALVLTEGAIASAASDCFALSFDVPTTFPVECNAGNKTLLKVQVGYSSLEAPYEYYLYMENVDASEMSAFGFDENDNVLCEIGPNPREPGPYYASICGPDLAYFTIYGND